MNEESKPEIPFTLKLGQAGQILGIPIGGVKALIRGKELEPLSDANGPLVVTQSVVEYLGRTQFKRRWPGKLGGRVTFDNPKEKKKESTR